MPVAGDHPSIPQAPEDNQVIWRFLTLEKLLAALVNESLYFAQVSTLQKDDPFESQFSYAQIDLQREIVKNPSLTDIVLKKITENSPDVKIDDPIIRARLMSTLMPETLEFFAKLSAGESYVNCWHINDHESAALWQLYCSNTSGVAIKSTVGALRNSLRNSIQDVYIGKIEYIDYRNHLIPTGNLFNTIFKKRMSFSHEQELRLCVTVSPEWQDGDDKSSILNIIHRNPPGIKVQCDISKLVQELVISPLSPKWFLDTVAEVVERLLPNITVRKSDLFEPPAYGLFKDEG